MSIAHWVHHTDLWYQFARITKPWALWRLESLTTLLIVQQLLHVNIRSKKAKCLCAQDSGGEAAVVGRRDNGCGEAWSNHCQIRKPQDEGSRYGRTKEAKEAASQGPRTERADTAEEDARGDKGDGEAMYSMAQLRGRFPKPVYIADDLMHSRAKVAFNAR